MLYQSAIIEKEKVKPMSLPDDARWQLPLLPAVFHIMVALADGERHGYGIKREVEFRTCGIINLGPGTLYGTLRRMLADGWIEECGERADPAGDDVRRRYYRLTDLGRQLAAAEAQRLESLVDLARAKNLLGSLKHE
jgi:DNA-binding PadR family transcriptional regulator